MEWEDVVMEVREFIREYLAEGGVVVHEIEGVQKNEISEESTEKFATINQQELGEVEMRIVDILDEFVKPAVESDGGNIRFMSYEEGVVSVLLQGACSGCPSSTVTLKQASKTYSKNATDLSERSSCHKWIRFSCMTR